MRMCAKTAKWLCVLALLVPAGAAWPGQGDESKPIDLKPPVLKKVRWQYLDKRCWSVYIDGSGRAWFLIRIFPSSGGRKGFSRSLTCPELPEVRIEISDKNVILGFDKRNRFWEVGPYGLCGTDVRTGKFTQYRPAPDAPKTDLPISSFALTMLVHSSGRVYFADSLGVHVLDGDKWSYQRFRPALKRKPRPGSGGWVGVRFVEGPGGLVYLWGAGEVTSGFWVHDGASWRHHSAGRLSIVAPLKGGYALVSGYRLSKLIKVCQPGKLPNPSSQPSKIPAKPYLKWFRLVYMATGPRGGTIVRTEWGKLNSIFVIRTDGTVLEAPPEVPASPRNNSSVGKCLKLRDGRVVLETQPFYTWDGEKYAPLFRKELYPHGRFLGTDRHGRVYITTEEQVIGFPSKRLAVYDPRYPDDRPTLKYECFPLRQRGFREYTASMDSKGRIWARLRVSKYPFLSRYSNGRWTHFPDPTVRKASSQVDAKDFADRFTFLNDLWRTRSPTDGSELKGLPGMFNPAQLQPLADGCMIASESCQQRAFFFDGVTWTAYESLPKLIENQYTRLTKLVDNSAFWWRAGKNRIGLDATGRIWVSWHEQISYSRKPFHKVYDGKQWVDFPHGYVVLFDKSGKRYVSEKRLYDSSVWPHRELTGLPSEVKVSSIDDWARTVHFDRKGRFWVYGRFNGPAYCFRSDGWKEVKVRGRCILEDSAGRKWFNGGFSSLTIIGTDGKVSKWYEHDMLIKTPIVQQGENVFWVAAGDGLMSLQVVKGRIRVKKHYTGLVPRGRVHWMAIDAEGSLWMSTSKGSGLYRIEIPPLDKQKD